MHHLKIRFRLDKKLMVFCLLAILAMLGMMFCVRGYLMEMLICAIMYILLAFVEVEVKDCRKAWPVVVGVGLLTALAAVGCAQSCIGLGAVFTVVIKPAILAWNLLSYFSLYMLFYALTRRIRAASIITVLLMTAISVVSVHILEFRGTTFQFRDLLYLQTAAAVAHSYRPFIDDGMATGLWLALGWIVWLCYSLRLPKKMQKMRWGRGLALVTACACFAGTLYGSTLYKFYPWQAAGINKNGLLIHMLQAQMMGTSVGHPEGYDSFDIAALEATVSAPGESERKPNVIVIMAESYADMRVYSGGLHTTEEVMPFYDSLTENTIKGFALASVFGGTTANSEYEFLSGNTMAFLPVGSAPFQQYVKEGDHSIVSHMESLGYRSIAMHPERPTNWQRNQAWKNLGFDEMLFKADFPREEIIHSGVSDREFVDQMLLKLRENEGDPLFLFGVTMQNHGQYNQPQTEITIRLEDCEGSYPKAEQYLSIMRISDDALAHLIDGLSQMEEETILLYFGDHQPRVEKEFYEEMNGGPLNKLDEVMVAHTVPFMIWANYDIPEAEIPLTSLNYLGGYLMEAAGLPLSAYQQYLKQLEEKIPAINALGYRSSTGEYQLFEKASAEEAELLQTYKFLQYNNIEAEDRSQIFFPDPVK